MNKHTPGPWKLLKFGDFEHYTVTNQEGTHGFHLGIAQVSFGYSEPAETEQHANAKLIAAAPELLDALRDLKALVRDGYQHNDIAMTRSLTQAQAAIEKATL